jgi:hypothetical protein
VSQQLVSIPERDLSNFPAGVLRPFMPELDTPRGIACLGVVVLHGFFWSFAGRLRFSKFGSLVGIPVKVNIDSGRKPNGVPERR